LRFVGVIGLLALGGCATQIPANVPVTPAAALAMNLARRDQALDSMQTPAVMEYSNGKDHFKAREQIVVRRPAKIRVEAMSPLGVALVVAADGGQISVFDPSKNTLIRGPATAATLERFAQIPMAPEAAVRLLLALAPDPAILVRPPDSTADSDGMTVVTYRKPDGLLDQLGFKEGRLALVREKLPDGRVSCEVRYGDYRDIGAMPFPYEIDADFPLAGTRIKLIYQRPIIDAQVPDSMFVLSPGPSARQINLSGRAAPADLPKG
jgi:hypothetical protein